MAICLAKSLGRLLAIAIADSLMARAIGSFFTNLILLTTINVFFINSSPASLSIANPRIDPFAICASISEAS